MNNWKHCKREQGRTTKPFEPHTILVHFMCLARSGRESKKKYRHLGFAGEDPHIK